MRHNSNPTVMSVLACVQVCVRSYEARELIWKQVHYCTEVMCECVLSSMYNIVSFPAHWFIFILYVRNEKLGKGGDLGMRLASSTVKSDVKGQGWAWLCCLLQECVM